MNILRIEASAFCKFVGVDLTLPPRGVVVVRGDNGSGKSSLYEAVAWGLWGETVRGTRVNNTMLAPAAPHVSVHLYGQGAHVARVANAAGAVKTLSTGDGVAYPTVSKAQEALTARLGWSFEEWVMTQVFSAANPFASFSRMKPSERVTALEALLGLTLLDDALVLAREDMRSVDRTLAKLGAQEAAQRAVVEQAKARLAESALHMEVHEPTTPREDPDLLARHLAAADAVDAARATVRAALEHARHREVLWHNAVARSKQASLPLQTECPTCKRPYDDHEAALEHWEEAKAAAEDAATEAALEFEAAEQKYNELATHAHTLEQAYSTLSEEVDVMRAAWDEHDYATAHNARIDATLERELALAEATLDETLHDKRAALREHATLSLVTKALGTSGVRAQALEGFLQVFSQTANAWLYRLSNGRVALKCALKTTPSNKQEVELVLTGVAGGQGYKGASTGEQRRIDLALLFALSDIASRAKGVAPGTLWVDEVFDTLDADGRAACAAVIEDIAKDRCVVVITHEDAVEDVFQTVTKRVLVSEGTL